MTRTDEPGPDRDFPEILTTAIERVGDQARIRLIGELDLSSAGQVTRAVAGLVADPDLESIEVDLTELTFVDSSGLNLLLNTRADVHASGVRFHVSAVSTIVRRTLHLGGLEELLADAGDTPD